MAMRQILVLTSAALLGTLNVAVASAQADGAIVGRVREKGSRCW